jgi:hypothetical protein
MNNAQAKTLVRDTFTHAFDKLTYQRFLRELLNRFDESKAGAWGHQYIKDAFKPDVDRYERLGTYRTPNKESIDLLIVYLTQDTKLQRARTALRNFVAHHLKQRDEKDAALVAFVSPSEGTWRFSFVKMQYATEQDERGRVAVSETLTPARRFSYLVGDGESCHTAQSRFLGLLQDTTTDPTLERIEDAFSVETVTREFFAKYYTLFERINGELGRLVEQNDDLRKEFKDHAISTVDFAKKLLGQIVFLYFIQKKGWLGVRKGEEWGSGPKDFLCRLAQGEYGTYGNFFNDVLEPLFYDTLATDRGHDAWCNRFKCRIPFLNGGLFEPLGDYNWAQTDIILPNEIFRNHDHTKEGDVGTGALDVFDRYNFTVNEAEPLEQEVAIDPEMLGKVFENLIEENRRRGLGAFYTPREIVHYMCQEALVQFLYSAINPQDEPVVRPPVIQDGLFSAAKPTQGVFTVPAAREKIPKDDLAAFIHSGEQAAHYEAARKAGTVSYRPSLPSSIEDNARLIDEKLRDIAVCDPAIGSGAFPVGMMTEIVRARMTLTPYFNDIRGRTPYHFKRHAIQNSLYGVDIDHGAVEIAKLRLWLSLVVDEEEVTHIKPLPNLDFKVVAGNSLLGFPSNYRSYALLEIERLKGVFFDEPDHNRKAALKRTIDQNIHDVLEHSVTTLGYPVDFDFWLFFSEVFRQRGGFDVVIANPPYVDSERMSVEQPALRATYNKLFSAAKGNWDLFVVFIEQGMRQLNSTGVISYIVPNKLLGSPYAEALRLLLRQRAILEIRDYSSVKVFKEAAVYPVVFRASMGQSAKCNPTMTVMSDLEEVKQSRTVDTEVFYADTCWDRYFGTESVFAVVMKVNAHLPLRQQCKEVGAAATVSEAYELKEVMRESTAAVGRRFKRFVNTGTIDRFAFLWGERPTRYIKSSYESPVVLDSDLRAMNPKRLQQANAPKIIIGGMTKVLECALDERGEYLAGKSTTIILDDDTEQLKFLLGVLNSESVTFWYRNYYKSLSLAGGYLRINQGEVKTIPIPKASPAERRRIISLVEKLLVADVTPSRRANLKDNLEKEIAGLYGLNEDELQIVQEHNAHV